MRFLLVVLLVAAGVAAAQTVEGSLTTPAELSKIARLPGQQANSPDTFRFAVIGDRTGEHVEGVLEEAVKTINLLRPDFVMNIGDLVEGFEKDQAGAEAEVKEIEGILGKLDAPFFWTPGNHDVPNAWYRKAFASGASRSATAGRVWFSFNYRSCHFVLFDSTAAEREIPGIAEEQWAWLEKDLAAAKDARHVFVFGHHPVYGDRGDWMRLRKMLHDGKTTLFCGHDHSLGFAVEHGLPYLMLGATGGFGGSGPWEKGSSHQVAWVTVSDGRPHVGIVPVGHVLPHDLRSGRQLAANKRAAVWGAEFTDGTRSGGEVTFALPNASPGEVSYTLEAVGDERWFDGRRPKTETVKLAAGKSLTRKFKLSGVSDPTVAPPTMKIAAEFAAGEETATTELAVAPFLRAVVTAARVSGIKIDGRLDDWKIAPAAALGGAWQVGDSRDAWTGPEDASATIRVGCDDANLYIAFDVTDDVLFSEAKESWRNDGIELFWDPRGADQRGGPFYAPCGGLAVPLPEEGKPAQVDGAKAQATVARRKGGYVVEVALPFTSIAKDFKPAAGATLRMEMVLNDRDEKDPPPTTDAKGKKKIVTAPTSCLSLSGYTKSNYRTWRYADVTFK